MRCIFCRMESASRWDGCGSALNFICFATDAVGVNECTVTVIVAISADPSGDRHR